MADHKDREHYIPLRKSDLITLLARDARLTPAERDSFRQFCKLVSAVWHFEYHDTLEKLKDSFAPFDPDTTCKPLEPVAAQDRPAKMEKLFDEFVGLMEKANFKRLSRKDVEAAVSGGASDWGINMSVDWDVFERLEVFVRGDVHTKRTKRGTFFFWRTETKDVESYQRLVLLLKLRKHKRLPENLDTSGVFLKMFKDIPTLDVEMVLPGTKLQMPWAQQSKMGVSLVGTLGYGIYKVFYQLIDGIKVLIGFTAEAAVTATSALWGPFLLLGGYAYKQYAGYQNTKQNYSKMLAESLYFQNLDNNAGVITQVVDEAEEQECRETILAYFYLWKYAPPQGWGAAQLDDYVEMDLEAKLGMKIDFEVADAVAKLENLGIVEKRGDNYFPVAIELALQRMDRRWDDYFQFSDGGTPAAAGKGAWA